MRKPSGESLNIVNENIEKLKKLFPEAFSEDKIDFDILKAELGEMVETKEERYSFNWNGKAAARRIAQTPSTGTLRPCPDESVDWDTTQNLFIEGDNLEVLKLLQKSYHSKVKMIYIDPPYNTGKEFIYPDNYRDNLDTYLEYTGQKDAEGKKFGTNVDTSGRYHTNWLNMMYPRLKLARNLLKDDGVIFISIDDNEVHNLRKICDEIFGEDNFLANFVWQSKKGGGSDSRNIVTDHEYVLCYAKAAISVHISKIMIEAEPLDKVDHIGPYRLGRELNKWGSNSRREDRPTMYFPISGPNNEEVFPIRNDGSEGCWRRGKTSMEELSHAQNIEFVLRDNGTYIAYEKIRTNEAREKPYRTFSTDIGATSEGSGIIKKLFDDKTVFDFPKPMSLLDYIIRVGSTGTEDIVLDFFTGSGTTAHAVMKFNAEDGGNRRSISVQLPESTDEKSEAYKAGYKTIAEISKERIRRAGKKIGSEALASPKSGTEVPLPLDLGFKVFKLDSSNIKAWDADFDNVEQSLLDAIDNVKADRTSEDLIYEILLKYGLDLTLPIETKDVAEQTAYIIGLGALVICLEQDINLDTVEAIAKLKEEYKPEIMRVIFKDAGFSNDVVKTNAIQILKQHGIDDVKSV